LAGLRLWASKTADGRQVLDQERTRLLALLSGGKDAGAAAAVAAAAAGGAGSTTTTTTNTTTTMAAPAAPIPPRQHYLGSVTQHEYVEDIAARGGAGGGAGESRDGIRLLVDLEGCGYVSLLCVRDHSLDRLAEALLLLRPQGEVNAGGVGGGKAAASAGKEGTKAKRLAQKLAEHKSAWGSLVLDFLVQEERAQQQEEGEEGEEGNGMKATMMMVVDVKLVPAAKRAYRLLEKLLRTEGGAGAGAGGEIV
jgi:hypothetical protein